MSESGGGTRLRDPCPAQDPIELFSNLWLCESKAGAEAGRNLKITL